MQNINALLFNRFNPIVIGKNRDPILAILFILIKQVFPLEQLYGNVRCIGYKLNEKNVITHLYQINV